VGLAAPGDLGADEDDVAAPELSLDVARSRIP
jgi:hypothetical protein